MDFRIMRKPDKQLRKLIGEKIRSARKERGMTQYEVVERIDIDVSHYQRIERGETNPSLIIAYRICRALRISLDDLFRTSHESLQ
ncbi:helix-turn-helix domain-containing protein [Tunicatimonas pelagia]|uniref:helix-turn-helix domain-containing protein n=1 Tax=Tunicatimonas pelagia TaxID=931531 RepID=UPI00266646DF|nr:helix-turn-helix transcriptional regulator [Tunicatimonas pelagia]WKN46165.1 helix-turn-helix transcriptional regulator [Tunicatimonas pelagia]